MDGDVRHLCGERGAVLVLLTPLVVEFDPWLWSDVPSLTRAFFSQIGAALEAQARGATEQDADLSQPSDVAQARTRRAQLWKR